MRIQYFTNQQIYPYLISILDFLQTLPFLQDETFQTTDFYSIQSNSLSTLPIYHHFIIFHPLYKKKMIGFCNFIEYETEIYIMVIGIDSQLSHQGYGSKMIEWIKYKNRKHKKKIRAQVHQLNTSSISFFKKHGFIIHHQSIHLDYFCFIYSYL